MSQWDPIDPDDLVDLWFDFTAPPNATKKFLPTDEVIDSSLVTVPDVMEKITESIEGQMVRFRVKPNGAAPGKYLVGCHIITDAGQEFDMDNTLIVKERVKK
jgi:hypothetical protein